MTRPHGSQSLYAEANIVLARAARALFPVPAARAALHLRLELGGNRRQA
jgi:hypothetical protein